MKTANPPTPPAAESALTPAPMIAYFDPAKGDDCGWIAIYRNDDTPTASLVSRLMDTPANRQHAAFIVEAVNAHAAAQQRIGELEKALDGIVDLYVSGYLKPEADGPARFYHAFKQARLALRHPGRT